MVRKRIKKVPAKINAIFNFTESYTSLILGAIVVLIVGILFISIARGNRNTQTSSSKDVPQIEQKNQEKFETVTTDNSKTSSTYTIKPGDDLWSISENIYKDGYKWVEIAKTNKIENPGLIHSGSKLIIPEIEKTVAMQPDILSQEANKITESNAINSATYSIKEGDNLWHISVRAYGDGFRWVELAKVNNIENPDLIYPDNVLKLPQ